eukprot:4633514-Heterocapsa_arctica.AAC.1
MSVEASEGGVPLVTHRAPVTTPAYIFDPVSLDPGRANHAARLSSGLGHPLRRREQRTKVEEARRPRLPHVKSGSTERTSSYICSTADNA